MSDTTQNQIVKTPLADIVICPQPRKTFRDIELLAADIRDHGLLQPVTITPSKRLLYGERRYRACKLLGLEFINVITCSEDLTEDEILERQIAENVARDDLSWQERCLALLDVYRLKRQRGALEGWVWGQREASELFKIQLGTVNYILRVAARLEQELTLPEDKRKFWGYGSAAEAYRLGLLQEQEDKLNAELAKRQQQNLNRDITNELELEPGLEQAQTQTSSTLPSNSAIRLLSGSDPTSTESFEVSDFERERYNSNPLNVIPFDEYIKERKALQEKSNNTIYLSSRVFQGDCIDKMNSLEWENFFDHIITDAPYAINMNMLKQSNTGMAQIDRVEDRHDVQENLDLLARFFPAAFKCTKDKSYVVTFCDPMVFRYMHDLATAAGFTVQRWPVIWRKVNQSSSNQSAHCNTTKDYEIILFCHKPGATFSNKLGTSILDGSNVEAKKQTSHPFAKPFDITKRIIETVTSPRQRILEPFAGGGSIALELLRNDRDVFMVEKEEHHFNMMLETLKREYWLKLNPNFVFK